MVTNRSAVAKPDGTLPRRTGGIVVQGDSIARSCLTESICFAFGPRIIWQVVELAVETKSIVVTVRRERRWMLCFSPSREPAIVRCWEWAIRMRSGRCTRAKVDTSRFGITFGRRSKTIVAYESITSYYPRRWQIDWKAAKSIRNLGGRKSPLTTPP